MTYTLPTSLPYRTYYDQQLPLKLQRAIAFIQQNQYQPDRLKPHFQSIITLLERGWLQPFSYSLVAELVTILHPWPRRWGFWGEWLVALRSVVDLFERLNRPVQQAEFLGHLADLLIETGNLPEALTLGKQGIELARQHQALLPLAVATTPVMGALRRLGQHEELFHVLRLFENDLAAWGTVDNRPFACAWLLSEWVWALRLQTRHLEAVRLAEETKTHLEAAFAVDSHLLATVYNRCGIIHWATADYETAITRLQQAISLFERNGDLVSASFAKGDLGFIYYSMARYEPAELLLQQALVICQETNAQTELIAIVNELSAVYAARGKLEENLYYVNHHIELARRLGNQRELNNAISNRGSVYAQLGRYQEAEKDLLYSLQEAQQRNLPVLFILNQFYWCLYLAGTGRQNEAQAIAMESYDAAEQILGDPVIRLFARRVLAQYVPPEKGISLLQEGLTMAQELKRPLDEAGCLLSLAGLTQDEARQKALWQQGAHRLAEIGATDWLLGHSPDNPPFIGVFN